MQIIRGVWLFVGYVLAVALIGAFLGAAGCGVWAWYHASRGMAPERLMVTVVHTGTKGGGVGLVAGAVAGGLLFVVGERKGRR